MCANKREHFMLLLNRTTAHLVAKGSSEEVFDECKETRACTLNIGIAFTLDDDTVEGVLSGQLYAGGQEARHTYIISYGTTFICTSCTRLPETMIYYLPR